jgi:DNA-binding PadR family transcriptional regulator
MPPSEYLTPDIRLDIFHAEYMPDPTPNSDISPLGLSILELLDERPMHPYELASTMRDRHEDEFIRLNFGSLYHTVEMLERNSWIEPVEREKEGRRPERTIYRLTDSGREQLVRVVSEILALPKREYPDFAAGLMFMHHLEAKDAASQLVRRAAALSLVIAKLQQIMTTLLEDGISRLAIIELEHKIAMLEAERAWVRRLEKDVTTGKLEWKVGGMQPSHELLRRRHGASTH